MSGGIAGTRLIGPKPACKKKGLISWTISRVGLVSASRLLTWPEFQKDLGHNGKASNLAVEIVHSKTSGRTVTRELIARKIRWSYIVWMAGLVNAVAMLPQFVQIIRTHNIQGLSLEMFVLYFLVQVAFSLEGFFTRNRMLMVCLALSAVVSAAIIVLVTYLRH